MATRRDAVGRPARGSAADSNNTAAANADPNSAANPQLTAHHYALNRRVDDLMRAQYDMATYVQSIATNYEVVVNELVQCRRNLATQDQMVRNLLQYLASNELTMSAALQPFSGYSPLAATSAGAGSSDHTSGNFLQASSTPATPSANHQQTLVSRE